MDRAQFTGSTWQQDDIWEAGTNLASTAVAFCEGAGESSGA